MQESIETLSNEEIESVTGGLDWLKALHALLDLLIDDHCETDPT